MWNLLDNSRKPHKICKKINQSIIDNILVLRSKTGWGENRLADELEIGHTTINKILNKHDLTKDYRLKRKRIKYIRFQREHPNSLWQIDHSDQKHDILRTLKGAVS